MDERERPPLSHGGQQQMSARVAHMLEALSDPFYTLDREWRYSYMNAAAERVLNLRREDVIGRVVWEKFPRARDSRFFRTVHRAMEENVTTELEEFYAPLGVWFNVRVFPSSDCLSVYFRDVTALHESREALRASEERFRLLANAANDAIWDWDLLTDERWLSEGCVSQFGHARGECIHSTASWYASIHPEDVEGVRSLLREAIDSTAHTWVAEYRLWHPDGRLLYVRDRGKILRDATGRATRMVGGMTDLTANRRAEGQLREQAALLDNASDGIIVRDLDDRVLYWNRSAERMHGFTADEACGQSFAELLMPPPAEYDAARDKVLANGEWIGELPLVAKGGEVTTVESRWTLMQNGSGAPSTILSFNTDITQRKRLEQQILRAQRMDSIGTLAGGIAHDLNNVLAPIMLSVEALQQTVQDPVGRETLALIGSSAERGASLIEQVLSFARGVEGQRVQVQLERVVREVTRIARDTFPRSISIVEQQQPGISPLIADPTQMQQVLLNLAVNARDAMPAGGTLTIRLEQVLIDEHYASMNLDARVGAYLRIDVEDTGTGIPADIMEKIFDPFFTTKEVGKGTGLGLSTSLAIVKSHGGFVRVYSDPGIGTRFRVYLPSASHDVMVEPDAAAGSHPRGNGETVLVVDDEESIRRITKQTLEGYGYRVLLAADGSEAISMFPRHQEDIAVVLADVMMPVIDGPTTVHVLRRLNPTLRVIATSGLSARGNPPRLHGAGLEHFLAKPYTAASLLSMLAHVLAAPA